MGGRGSARAARTALRAASRRPGGPDPPRYDVILLARDAAGYANLCRLITDAHMAGERGDPSLTAEQICAHPDGLVALLGPDSSPGKLAIDGRPEAARLRPRAVPGGVRGPMLRRGPAPAGAGLRRRDPRAAAARRAAETRAVATNPVRYLVPEDAFLADALECMREIVPINRHNVSRVNAEGWLKPAREMRWRFEERPDLLEATLDIAESCSFDLGLRQVHFPDFPTPAGRSASSVLAERCWRGLERRGMKPTRRVRDRLDHELAMIHRLGVLRRTSSRSPRSWTTSARWGSAARAGGAPPARSSAT